MWALLPHHPPERMPERDRSPGIFTVVTLGSPEGDGGVTGHSSSAPPDRGAIPEAGTLPLGGRPDAPSDA